MSLLSPRGHKNQNQKEKGNRKKKEGRKREKIKTHGIRKEHRVPNAIVIHRLLSMQDILTYDCSPKRRIAPIRSEGNHLNVFESTSCSQYDTSITEPLCHSDAMGGAPTQPNNEDVIDVPIDAHGTVSDWLLSLGLQQYLGLLIANGFDDPDFLVSHRHRSIFHSQPKLKLLWYPMVISSLGRWNRR